MILKDEQQYLYNILPQNIKDSKLSDYAKITLAGLWALTKSTDANKTGVVKKSISSLKKFLKMGDEYIKLSMSELESCNLLKRYAGRARSKGDKGEATGYELNFDNIEHIEQLDISTKPFTLTPFKPVEMTDDDDEMPF